MTAVLSPVKLATTWDDLIVITVNRDITTFDELSELVSNLRNLEQHYLAIMRAHPDSDTTTLISRARIEWISSNSPIEISIDVNPTLLAVLVFILMIVEKYPTYKENIKMIIDDLNDSLKKVDGVYEELRESIARDFVVSLEAYLRDAQDAWELLKNDTRRLREYFGAFPNPDFEFRIEEMGSVS